MRDLVLAIDLGFSWCKAAYLDPAGNLVATGRSYTRSIPPTRVEMMESLWQAVGASVRAATAHLPAAAHTVATRITAIAISCRGEFGFCLDEQGQGFWPIWNSDVSWSSPYVLQAYSPEVWQDQEPFVFGYAMRTASFLLYLKSERPDEWRQIARIGALRDYLVYRLAGVWVTDPTSGPGESDWPPEIIAMTEMARDSFPPALPPQQVVGGLLLDAAELLELPVGTPVVVGLHDGAASSIGARSIQVGDACLTLGTNFVLRAITGERLTARSFSYLVLPERWAWVNNVHKASAQLDIVAELLCAVSHQEQRDLQTLHRSLGESADDVMPGCNGLALARMLAGQEQEFRAGVHAAQQAGHSQGHIYRAIMEALASGVLDLLQRARCDGARPIRFVATGGGVHNRHFLRLLAAMLDAPIEVAQAEAGLIGAGVVAAVGGGWYATITEAVAAMTAPGEVLHPDPGTAEYYRIQREHDGVNL